MYYNSITTTPNIVQTRGFMNPTNEFIRLVDLIKESISIAENVNKTINFVQT